MTYVMATQSSSNFIDICNFHSINFFFFEHNFFPARYNLKEYVQQVHHHRLIVVVCYIIKYHKKCKPYSVTWPIQFTLHYVSCVYGRCWSGWRIIIIFKKKIKLLYKIDFNLRQLNFICYKHVINWMLLYFGVRKVYIRCIRWPDDTDLQKFSIAIRDNIII